MTSSIEHARGFFFSFSRYFSWVGKEIELRDGNKGSSEGKAWAPFRLMSFSPSQIVSSRNHLTASPHAAQVPRQW
jgi:hypothetical protein